MTDEDGAMSEQPDFAAIMPFAVALGIRITSATAEEVIGELDWAPDRTTLGGGLHGGALMAFADSVGAVCAFLNLPPGAATSTTSSSTVFTTQLRDDEGRLVAQVTQTQAVLIS
jgi:uncharacterized protein (TIGR00369 family)